MPLTHKTTTTNERTNEWSGLTIYKNHSTNYLAAHVNRITICCFPTKKHISILIGLLITGCGFLRMTRAQYHGQESECKHHGGVKIQTNIWCLLKHAHFFLNQKCSLCITCVFTDGKIFQNRRVSSPAPVTMVCKLHRVILLIFLDIISA